MSTEIKADLTEVSNKAYDDFAKPTATGIKFIKDFLTSGVKPYMYQKIKESQYRIQEINDELEKRYNDIPLKNQIEPRISILGPAIEVMKYNLDENHIKDMFISILVNEMDNRKQNGVLPAYISIINQIGKEEAEFLNFIANLNGIVSSTSLLEILDKRKKEHLITEIDYYVVIVADNKPHYKKISKLSLDNLERLGIIKFNTSLRLTDISGKSEVHFKEIVKNDYENQLMDYKLASFEVTMLGLNFIEICCS